MQNHTWVSIHKYIDFMHSFTAIHESRNLKQARPKGQYVDLLRFRLLLPHEYFYRYKSNTGASSLSTTFFVFYQSFKFLTIKAFVYCGSKLFILFKLIPKVDALCKSAEAVGCIIPHTPSKISPEFIPTMLT